MVTGLVLTGILPIDPTDTLMAAGDGVVGVGVVGGVDGSDDGKCTGDRAGEIYSPALQARGGIAAHKLEPIAALSCREFLHPRRFFWHRMRKAELTLGELPPLLAA